MTDDPLHYIYKEDGKKRFFLKECKYESFGWLNKDEKEFNVFVDWCENYKDALKIRYMRCVDFNRMLDRGEIKFEKGFKYGMVLVSCIKKLKKPKPYPSWWQHKQARSN